MVTPFDLVIPLLGRLGKVSKLERKKLQGDFNHNTSYNSKY